MVQRGREAEYLSVAHTALLTDSSTKTVRRWLNLPTDALPAIRLGTGTHARIRIPRRDLVAWLERRRAVPSTREIVDAIVHRAPGDSGEAV